ncbi:hypothetical protein ACNQGB_16485 [Flavobacterium sp. XS1P32]
MIVWSGRGFLSIIVLLVTLLLCVSIFPTENADYGFIITAFVTGIFSWYFGTKWNTENERILIDEKTGQRLKIKNNHTLFWISMQYWGIIFILLGIVILIQNLDKDGIELYLNIFLGLLGIVCLVIFSIKIFKNSIENKVETDVQTKSNRTKVDIAATPKFEKVGMKEIKTEIEDHNRFIPK